MREFAAAILTKCMVSNRNKNVWNYRKFVENLLEEQVKCETFMPNAWSLAGLFQVHVEKVCQLNQLKQFFPIK